uniref:Protein-lysine N-methyltransferase n=1 Tax=Chlamydomonas leiostraca TaxID=1034604 RepID=A0A7S0RNF7_9CHLO|mmetsp:Transcript_27566/g.70224  ORF Transcript_27566/g.70224 Transcript_27566/m.70224 type:complete len:191 (+) Transcript_27566:102-674(+)|eukprot:CAMPEP_0202876426 /NCGR_PEP_ID=MMETSP1391-20130828/28969_1 /ASSEMBLY_ACC=CAM_ASM_000867 /TAXON_ID=1034604 /ORGANISM="Chlamydomonas leiostraca, Strain SAG 11-49" /LENGTH=190 /DNA_ID=CAMNT_0049558267 /DNA_START=17 /DNA_END=589 /DNA_ORIENTATION=-
MEQPKNAFLMKHTEKEEFNQYWYSSYTIEALVKELCGCGATKAAFLSTPSVFFSLPKGSDLRAASWVFDYDEQWARSEPHFCKYDFKAPDALPAELRGAFDAVVIDPPFITHEVWELYAQAAKMLLAPGGKVLASTVAENAPLMESLLGAKPCAFKPSIPHLVYQYNFFTSYEPTPEGLGAKNPEVPEDD